jgi:hypothetical protein
MGQPFTNYVNGNCPCISGYLKINGVCAVTTNWSLSEYLFLWLFWSLVTIEI